jgi:hypothetical protein
MPDLIYYLLCAVCVGAVLLGINMMSKVKSSVRGNALSAVAVIFAMALVFGLRAWAADISRNVAIIVALLDHVNPVSFAIIVILMALITGCMHAANHIFITRIPGAFKKAGRVSGIVGVLNAITYIGSALSPTKRPAFATSKTTRTVSSNATPTR